jgi:hypothetical protein
MSAFNPNPEPDSHAKHETKRRENLKAINTKFTDMVEKQHAQIENKERSLALLKKYTRNLDWNAIEDENAMFDESYTYNDYPLVEFHRENLQKYISLDKFLRSVHTADNITLRETANLNLRTDAQKKADRIRKARELRTIIANRTNKVKVNKVGGGKHRRCRQTKKRKHK